MNINLCLFLMTEIDKQGKIRISVYWFNFIFLQMFKASVLYIQLKFMNHILLYYFIPLSCLFELQFSPSPLLELVCLHIVC